MKKFTLPKLALSLSVGCVLAASAHWGCGQAQVRPAVPVEPVASALFSSTRSITSLTVDGSGALWAATTGGVLRRSSEGMWTKFSRQSGLPSIEGRKIFLNENDEVEVLLPRAKATWKNESWQIEEDAAPPNAPQAVDVEWNDKIVQAAPDVFRVRAKNAMDWQTIELPKSRGSHISVLLVQDGVLWASLYGDGIWSYDGQEWKRLEIALPESAREVTALAFDEKTKTLWVGTRRDGIWQYSLAGWRQHLQADEPLDHNAQYLALFNGDLYMSTLEDGLQKRDAQGWQQLGGSTLSSEATRHLVEFDKKLFVRHGGGKVDSFDGKNWTRDAFPTLPRKKAFALAADEDKLLVAQWGGWSEWNGQVWTHFLKIPELQGLPIMAILPVDDKVWIGTQSRGVGEYSRKTNKLKWHDERNGLPDDWIICFAKSKKILYAGTFVGGLAFFDGRHWKTIKELDGDNVTALGPDGQGGVLIATRRGVWHRSGEGTMKNLNAEYSWLDSEAQALLPTKNGNWIGLRTGLVFLKNPANPM